MNPFDIVFFIFCIAAFLMFINGYYVNKISFGNDSEKEKAKLKWKQNNWVIFYLIIAAIALAFFINFFEAVLSKSLNNNIEIIFYACILFIVLSVPLMVLLFKTYKYYEYEVENRKFLKFLKLISYLKKPNSIELSKYRLYTLIYAIALIIVISGMVLTILSYS